MINFFVTGITGQDGIFLTKKILEENKFNRIYGISREKNHLIFYKKLNSICEFDNSRIDILDIDLLDKSKIVSFLTDVKPSQIYNLSGPSSVYESYKNPSKSDFEITTIFNNLTSSLIELDFFPKFFQASSSEMYGALSKEGLNEKDDFEPISPYAIAKLKNHKNVSKLRDKYNWEIYSGILFNHESQFREKNYLLMKIISKANKISENKENKITLGSLDYKRDWTYAGDTVDGIFKITNSNTKDDYVIGSGKLNSIQDMAEIVFEYFNLNLQKYINIDPKLLRKNDPKIVGSDPSKLISQTGWKNKFSFEEMIYKTIDNQFL